MNTASVAAAVAPAAEPVREDKMPTGIWFIVSNEFAERFCFYGINSILAIYMTTHLHFTDAKATEWQSMFKSGAYFFPMLGAIISDVFWGKFKTIITFSMIYALGCLALAFFGNSELALAASLFFIGLGTGGIKPCVSTNVGDQFTAKNQHLIERAFSLFYLAINLGSSISIYYCPVLLNSPNWGPKWAFGLPAVMMVLATAVFWAGRHRFATVPPAGKKWWDDVRSDEGKALVKSISIVFLFVAFFWMLWDQSNGNTWTLQAQSSLMDKNLGFGYTLLPAQVQVVNGLFILAMVPIFTFVIYPVAGKFFTVTPLRKIGAGLFVAAASFAVVGWIEQQIQSGRTVSAWWQIFAYMILTASEVLVSITALEFAYKQAPLRMKSFIMSLFLLSTALGNLMVARVNKYMVKPLEAQTIEAGTETWVKLPEAAKMEFGQKIDFTNGVGLDVRLADGKTEPLQGTYLIAEVDSANSRVRIMDSVDRKAVSTVGTFNSNGSVSTYYLVGPMYFYFFIGVVLVMAFIFILYARVYKEKTHVRDAAPAAA